MKKLLLLVFAGIAFAAEPDPPPPAGMVYVPAGSFIMGSEVGDPDERPQHMAATGAFFIDKYEVSCEEYMKFDPDYRFPLAKRNHPSDPDFLFPPGYENFPVIVTWEQANAYARWAGKRLPTEKEWEKAARGTDGRMFPWGNTYDDTYVVWDLSFPRGSAIAKPESPYGCVDMAGSVWEWTADWYQPYPGNPLPMEQYGEKYKVMRGGSNFNDCALVRTTQRYYVPPNSTGRYSVGFRCVKDID